MCAKIRKERKRKPTRGNEISRKGVYIGNFDSTEIAKYYGGNYYPKGNRMTPSYIACTQTDMEQSIGEEGQLSGGVNFEHDTR